MTRKEILEAYNINEYGIITSPGKFEGDMLYAPYFWDSLMDGGADEIEYDGDIEISIFRISPEDVAEFPEIEDAKVIKLWETEQGFVYVGEEN